MPPIFPESLRDGERETMLRDILAEMVEYLRGSEVDCRHEGDEIEVTWKNEMVGSRPAIQRKDPCRDGSARQALPPVVE